MAVRIPAIVETGNVGSNTVIGYVKEKFICEKKEYTVEKEKNCNSLSFPFRLFLGQGQEVVKQ